MSCYCTALHFTLFHFTLHCNVLHFIAPRCTALHCHALHCHALPCTAITALLDSAVDRTGRWSIWAMSAAPLVGSCRCLRPRDAALFNGALFWNRCTQMQPCTHTYLIFVFDQYGHTVMLRKPSVKDRWYSSDFRGSTCDRRITCTFMSSFYERQSLGNVQCAMWTPKIHRRLKCCFHWIGPTGPIQSYSRHVRVSVSVCAIRYIFFWGYWPWGHMISSRPLID